MWCVLVLLVLSFKRRQMPSCLWAVHIDVVKTSCWNSNCQFNNFLQNEIKCVKLKWIETSKKKKNRCGEQKVALNIISVAQYIHIHVNTMAVLLSLYVNLPESGALSMVLKLSNSLTSLTSCCDYNIFKCQMWGFNSTFTFHVLLTSLRI